MAVEPTLRQFKAIIFDVYGTLVDWEFGIYDRLQPVLQRASGEKSRWTREEALLAFTSVEKDIQVQHPEMLYTELLATVYEQFSKRFGVAVPPEEAASFGESIQDWPIFPDTVTALAALSKHFKLTVLSNVDRTSFSLTRAQLEQGFTFDFVLTAQDVGSYKPNIANFQYSLAAIQEKFGIEKDQVLVVAQSLFHDHMPANSLGIASVWIEREGASMGMGTEATYVFHYRTLGEMAAALGGELQS